MCVITLPSKSEAKALASMGHNRVREFRYSLTRAGKPLDVDLLFSSSQPTNYGLEYVSRPTFESVIQTSGSVEDYPCFLDLLALRQEFGALPRQYQQMLHHGEYYALGGESENPSGESIIPYITAVDFKVFIGFASVKRIIENNNIVARLMPSQPSLKVNKKN